MAFSANNLQSLKTSKPQNSSNYVEQFLGKQHKVEFACMWYESYQQSFIHDTALSETDSLLDARLHTIQNLYRVHRYNSVLQNVALHCTWWKCMQNSKEVRR